jgi:hypothetical protein
MGAVTQSLELFMVTLLAAIMLIILAVIFFGLTLWIIGAASAMFFGSIPDANWAVLSAALLSLGAVLAGAIQSRH